MNVALIVGRLGKDADVSTIGSGSEVAKFSVATVRKWKDKKTGETKEETTWLNCVQWSPGGLANYLKKGTLVSVQGRISVRSYDDKTGQKRYLTEINAESVQLLGGKTDNQSETPPIGKPMALDISDDDIPF